MFIRKVCAPVLFICAPLDTSNHTSNQRVGWVTQELVEPTVQKMTVLASEAAVFRKGEGS